MKNTLFLGFGALALVGAAAVAVPAVTGKTKADADGNGLVSKSEAMDKADQKFAMMDVNGDGKVSVDDRDAMAKKHFAEMDADKNGSISEAEFNAARVARKDAAGRKDGMRGGHRGHHGRGGHMGGGRGMAMMAMADADGDKAITKAEFRAAAEARFAAADTDKSGSLSAEERQAARTKMRAMKSAPAAK